jgi:23S rRNA pseudouridine2605 synthase
MDSDDKTIRLHAYLARAGVASRRACEALILQGHVQVNGSLVTEMGVKVGPSDEVRFDGAVVSPAANLVYIALNKPPGYLCASSDGYERKLAIDLLKPFFRERLFNVGRLDYRSSGLILFTNDGAFDRRISHPSAMIEKEYVVETDREIPDLLLENFKKGVVVEGETYRLKEYRKTSPFMVHIVLIEGKNREIRKVLDSSGVRPLRLHRIRIGGINLEGLSSGEYRLLTEAEVASLSALAGGNS